MGLKGSGEGGECVGEGGNGVGERGVKKNAAGRGCVNPIGISQYPIFGKALWGKGGILKPNSPNIGTFDTSLAHTRG